MNNIIKKRKGFTLVELVIVIVIVGILSVISVPIYRGYVEKAMMTEGKVLIGAIAKSELAYHVEHGYFLNVGWTNSSRELDIDVRGNKYFREFYAQSGGGSYYTSSNISAVASIEKDSYNYDNDSVYIEVYGWNNGKSWRLRAMQYADGGLWGYGPNGDIVDERDELPMLL